MNLDQRKHLLVQLGKLFQSFGDGANWPGYEIGITEEEFIQFDSLVRSVRQFNGWFTEENVRKALTSWGAVLSAENIEAWLGKYDLSQESRTPKTVAVIGAGNIPMVALHDIISVFVSGNKALVKLSKDDDKLIPALLALLQTFEDEFKSLVQFTDGKLENFDAAIATGSNNSSRYFNYYFKSYPHIIRKNRTSVAILSGSESPDELKALGHDVFDYFGLGCRNVTKLFLPEGYDIDSFFKGIYDFNAVIHHNKYANNYDYNKAVWLLNREQLLDNGFLLLKKDESLTAPTASLFYDFYHDEKSLREFLSLRSDELQCVVGKNDLAFGSTQCPMLWDYADGVDTLQFLQSL